ncbi:MAG: hypothetical protein WBF33_07225 [Candidatus Nitrosopolaris sp.]
MSKSGKDFDWKTLYKCQKIKTTPCYNENFDPDLEKESDERKIINDAKFLDSGTSYVACQERL